MSTHKPTILTVDIVVVVDYEDVLLERRAIPPHMDKLVFPGGHVDAPDPERKIKADPSIAHAGAREALEEMGLVIKPEDLRFLMILDAPDRDERQDARRVSIALIVHRTSAEVAGVRAASDAKEIVRRKINSLREEELGFDHWKLASRLQSDLHVSRLFWNETNEYGLPKHTCPAMVDNAWANDIEIVYSFEEKGAFIECTESGPADFSERINFCPACGVSIKKPDGTRLVSEPVKKSAKDFFFHVSEADGQVFATITSIKFWKQHHCVDDTDNDALLLEEYGLYLLQESDYEPKTPMTAAEFRSFLLAAGFVEDPEFTAFLERCK